MYVCFHCGQKIENGSAVAAIIQGTINTNTDIIDNKPGALLFHEECYKEIAGSNYCPQNYENPCFKTG